MSLIEFDKAFFSERCRTICGVDEAGRGPLAGPVVAAAVVFDESISMEGVNDSKKLKEDIRERLFVEIHEKAVSVGVGIVDHATIDRINILGATHMAAKKALKQLREQPPLILTDYLKLKRLSSPVRYFKSGDSRSHVIAAASIIAKVTRDRIMRDYHKKYPEYNFAQNKGYGTQAHLAALLKYGPCPIHRLTFNGTTRQSFL